MRLVSPLILVGILATACGTQSKSNSPAAPAPTAEQTTASQLPSAAIVRVNLADGTSETRTTSASSASLTDAAVASAFDGGSKANVVQASELDKSSSTQSWVWGHSGNNYGYGGGYGRGYGNYGGYNTGYGYGYGYTAYYGGYNYGYGYNSYYNNGGYGYYSYCR